MINWEELIELHGRQVWRTVCRLLNNTQDAQDCYQETFLRAIQYSKKQPVKNWNALLKRIGTARALDQLRKRYRQRTNPLEEEVVDSSALSIETTMQEKELLHSLRYGLTQLSENQATTFWLCEVEQLSHPEVAEQMSAKPSQVALWLHRAKKQLRISMAEWKVEN